MRIGLVRHFEVINTPKKYMTNKDFEKWVEEYDQAEIKLQSDLTKESDWEICFSSDLPRAENTANYIFEGEVIKTELLREILIAPFTKCKIVLPHTIWLALGRIAFLFSHQSQPENVDETKNRVQKFLAEVTSLSASNVLIVTHGFLMGYIKKELIKRGFKGDNFKKPYNGRIYVFEKV